MRRPGFYSSLNEGEIDDESVASSAFQLNQAPPIDIADFIVSERDFDTQFLIFNTLDTEKAQETFPYLPFKIQQLFLQEMPTEREVMLLDALDPDDRTAILEELPAEQVTSLLKHLSPKERELSIRLLGYPKNSVGRLMTPDYLAIGLNWTVEEVLTYIREKGRDSETLNVIYVVDDHGILVDDFRIRELLLSPLDTVVSDLADHLFLSLFVNDSETTAINLFRKYGRSALPVIDHKGTLLGIVTFDDILALSTEEDTEDIQKIGGVEALREPYLSIPFWALMQKRIGWLTVLFFGELLTASAMGYFEDEIAQAVVLALFLPLIISSGGNAGSQASTLIVRAIALGEITLSDWWRIIRREVFSGLFLGTVLGAIGFVRVSLWALIFPTYGEHWLLIALTIFFSLIGVVLWGTVSGAILPLILNRLGFDPATSSTPFVATLVDVTGLIIYFNIAFVFLRGTLL